MRLGALLAALLVTAPAAADDPCTEAAELRDEVEALAGQIQDMTEAMKPVCAQKALARECARRRVEVQGFMRSLRELNAKRKAAEAECRRAAG